MSLALIVKAYGQAKISEDKLHNLENEGEIERTKLEMKDKQLMWIMMMVLGVRSSLPEVDRSKGDREKKRDMTTNKAEG